VFQAEDPGTPIDLPQRRREKIPAEEGDADANAREQQPEAEQDAEYAGIRIDLSRIGGSGSRRPSGWDR
jgi:hypothetical protein